MSVEISENCNVWNMCRLLFTEPYMGCLEGWNRLVMRRLTPFFDVCWQLLSLLPTPGWAGKKAWVRPPLAPPRNHTQNPHPVTPRHHFKIPSQSLFLLSQAVAGPSLEASPSLPRGLFIPSWCGWGLISLDVESQFWMEAHLLPAKWPQYWI